MNASDDWQFTPLHEAAAKVKVEVCSLLLRWGANPYLKELNGKTAIDVAGSDKLKERIIYEHRGYTFLAYIRNGDLGKIKKSLSHSSVYNHHQSQFNSSAADSSSDQFLISSSTSPPYSSSFHKSESNNYFVPIEKSSPSSSNCNSYSNCTIHHPHHHNQFTSDLIHFKNPSNGCSPLHYIADAASNVTAKQREKIVKFLIDKKASINETNSDGLTPLMMALENGHFEVAEWLLKNKARVDITDNLGRNALHRAAEKGSYEAVQLLLSYDAEIHALTPSGLTAEMITTSDSIKKLLLNHKLINNHPELKLLDAARNGDLQTVTAILEAGPYLVNCRDVDGRQSTPLHFAAGYNHPEVVKLLLEKGADIQARDKGMFDKSFSLVQCLTILI